MRVVVVAKTRMRQNVCVGAVVEHDGELLRLMPRQGAEFHSWPQFSPAIGEVVEVNGAKHESSQIEPPHVEDFLVDRWNRTHHRIARLGEWIRTRCNIWRGGRESVFEGRLRFTSSGKGRVERSDELPLMSVGFWILPRSLRLQQEGKRSGYVMTGEPPFGVPYVGLTNPVREIARGTLVRLSLARWWAPDDGSRAEACWLQLSGWY